MQVHLIDERDTIWENSAPRFRVLIHEHDVYSSYDIVEADLYEVVEWAGAKGAGASFGVAVKVDEDAGDGIGLVWLIPPPTP